MQRSTWVRILGEEEMTDFSPLGDPSVLQTLTFGLFGFTVHWTHEFVFGNPLIQFVLESAVYRLSSGKEKKHI